MRQERINKAQAKLLFINNLIRRRRNEAGAGILALVVLHFVSQFIFFPEENFLSRKADFEPQSEQKIAVKAAPATKPDAEIKAPAERLSPETVQPIALPKPKAEALAAAAKKKNDVREPQEKRESEAERLRRAERLLTGN